MSNLQPIPQTPISESQPWRDWFRSLGSYLSGGASGTFTTADSKTVTVVNGIITSIK